VEQYHVMRITQVEKACSEFLLKYRDDINDNRELEGEKIKFVGCAINAVTKKVICCYVYVEVD
jgi:hypothetical protein